MNAVQMSVLCRKQIRKFMVF